MTQTTERQHITKHIRVNMPDAQSMKTAWKQAKLKEHEQVRADDQNPMVYNYPEGATRRFMKWGEYALYVCHIGGGRVDSFEPIYAEQSDCIGEGAYNLIGEVAGDAFDNTQLVKEGFEIYAESRLYFEYKDDEGEIVPNEYGNLDDPTDYAVNVMVYKHTPVKATEQTVRLVQAYQHFLFYIDVNHMRENDPWSATPGMFDHFEAKLRGFYKRESSEGGPHLIDVGSIVKWVQELSDHYQNQLFDYIYKFHIDRY